MDNHEFKKDEYNNHQVAHEKVEQGSSDDHDPTEQAYGVATNDLKRQLKSRHIAMIRCVAIRYPDASVQAMLTMLSVLAVSRFRWSNTRCTVDRLLFLGVIGTGLFLGTAGALANGGPVGLLLGYLIIGTVCYSVMISLGEMLSYLPIPGGHITLAGRFVDPAFSFSMGWNYWYSWVITLPAELSAAAVLINFWDKVRDHFLSQFNSVRYLGA